MDKDERERRKRIHEAVKQGAADEMRTLIASGAADPHERIGDYDDWTPLTLAAVYGNLAVVELLLDAGVHPDARNRFGLLPSVLAASGDAVPHPEVVDLLLRRGADPDAEMKGRPARHWLDRLRTEHDHALDKEDD